MEERASYQTNTEYRAIEISREEREKFIAGNNHYVNFDQAFVWLAVSNADVEAGTVYFFDFELEAALQMAEKTGLPALAQRIREAM